MMLSARAFRCDRLRRLMPHCVRSNLPVVASELIDRFELIFEPAAHAFRHTCPLPAELSSEMPAPLPHMGEHEIQHVQLSIEPTRGGLDVDEPRAVIGKMRGHVLCDRCEPFHELIRRYRLEPAALVIGP